MTTTQLTSATVLNTTYRPGSTPSIIKLSTYTSTWKKFKKWYDDKFFPLNESRFLHSGFLNQQGYLISFLKSCGVNPFVYWESNSNVWVSCVNSREVDYHANYDAALLAAITRGFIATEAK